MNGENQKNVAMRLLTPMRDPYEKNVAMRLLTPMTDPYDICLVLFVWEIVIISLSDIRCLPRT